MTASLIDGDVLLLTGEDVMGLLEGRERAVVDAVRAAYLMHAGGKTSLPHSVFLTFPGDPVNRIIALPAYVGGDRPTAGIKWVASFPGNTALGLDRASAVLLLNSVRTGLPQAIIEASLINAKRTAASAALAAAWLEQRPRAPTVGLIGCGAINFEVARFLCALRPETTSFVVFDRDPERAEQFAAAGRGPLGDVRQASTVGDALCSSSLVSIATTAVTPHISSLSECGAGTLLLNISLRDLAPAAMSTCCNIVDDADHVCRAETSAHLTERLTGSRRFIKATLGEILAGSAEPPAPGETTVFSPFGLGILDVAVGRLVLDIAIRERLGTVIERFVAPPWRQRAMGLAVRDRVPDGN